MSVPRRLAVAVAAGVLAAACSPPPAFRPRPAAPGARAGGTLVVAMGEPQAIDPALVSAFDAAGSLVVRTLCDTLVGFDPRTGAPTPALAEFWEVTDGGRRVVLRLRRGARFQDGSPVTAEDVAFSLSRVADERTASPVAGLLEPVVGYRELHGEEEPRGQARRELRGVRVIDERSLEVLLERPRADFLRVLGHPLAAPVPRRAVEADPRGFGRRPVCAGPYRLAEPWEPGRPVIRLVRWAGYRPVSPALTAGGRGYVDAVEFRVFPDRASEVQAFLAGTVDVAHVPRAQLARARALGADLVTATTPTLEYVGLPVTQGVFSNRLVRVALSQALDRVALVEAVFEGAREPATGFLPPTVGEGLYRERACGVHAPPRADLARARAALRAAGVDLGGRTLRLYFNDEFDNRRLAEAVAAQWRAALGVTVELVPMGWEQYLARGTGPPGFDGPFRMGWAAQVPSADAYLEPLFGSQSIGRDNLTRFSDREFDRTLEREARRAVDAETRDAAYRELEDIVCGLMPAIPLAWGSTSYLVRRERVGSALGPLTDRTTGRLLVRELYLR